MLDTSPHAHSLTLLHGTVPCSYRKLAVPATSVEQIHACVLSGDAVVLSAGPNEGLLVPAKGSCCCRRRAPGTRWA